MKRVLNKAEVKRTFEVIKLLKTVYADVVFISYASAPVNIIYDHLGNPDTDKIFKRSYFTNAVGQLLVELAGSTMSIVDAYNAFKKGADTIEIKPNKHIIVTSEDKEYMIGIKLDTPEHDKLLDEGYGMLKPFYDKLGEINTDTGLTPDGYKYDQLQCGPDIVTRLINYETVTLRSEVENDVGLILTCKCFPNIKKCDTFTVGWLYKDEDERFMCMVSSSFPNKIGFRMFIDALRC